VFEKDPELGHSGTVNNLHELRDIHILVAKEGLMGHVAVVRKLLEDVSCMLMGLVAPEKDTRFLA
jgi:hypothetical protein